MGLKLFDQLKNAQDVINFLGLEKFPGNGGWYKLIYHDVTKQCQECKRKCEKAHSTTILHLFLKNTPDRWFRLNSTLIWNFLAGAPLELLLGNDDGSIKSRILGNNFKFKQYPLTILPKNCWGKLSSKGEWSLVSYCSTPGIELDKIEIAQNGWSPAHI